MKKTKVLLTLACAVLLVAASVMGTMAYLTATSEVKNTFTVGKVTLGGDNKAGLDEAKTNPNGLPLDKDGKELKPGENGKYDLTKAERVTANTYKLQPGHTYTKDPTIHVGDDSDDCYLFVKVENGIADIEATDTDNIAAQMAAKGWKALGEEYENIYVYVGTEKDATNPLAVSAGTDVVVFEQFKIDGSIDNATLKTYEGKEINVTAWAVQKDGFEGKTAEQIWNATGATPTT